MKKVVKIICVFFSKNLLITDFDCIKANEIRNECKFHQQLQLAQTKEKNNGPFSKIQQITTLVSQRRNKCCDPGDDPYGGNNLGGAQVIPAGAPGSGTALGSSVNIATCCTNNMNDINALQNRVSVMQRQIQQNDQNLNDYGLKLNDYENQIRQYETTIEAQQRDVARLQANQNDLKTRIGSINNQLNALGSQNNQVGADDVMGQLLDQIKTNGLRIGNWKFSQCTQYEDLLLRDIKRCGIYKFLKTQEPRVVQGIKDPGPSNGKRLNPLAALGISPVGTVKGVQKTFVTALY